MSWASNKSIVSKQSVSRTPSFFIARVKLLTFSICLKASLLELIFFTLPGSITFISSHSTRPSCRCSANGASNGLPVTAAIHASTSCCVSLISSNFSAFPASTASRRAILLLVIDGEEGRRSHKFGQGTSP